MLPAAPRLRCRDAAATAPRAVRPELPEAGYPEDGTAPRNRMRAAPGARPRRAEIESAVAGVTPIAYRKNRERSAAVRHRGQKPHRPHAAGLPTGGHLS